MSAAVAAEPSNPRTVADGGIPVTPSEREEAVADAEGPLAQTQTQPLVPSPPSTAGSGSVSARGRPAVLAPLGSRPLSGAATTRAASSAGGSVASYRVRSNRKLVPAPVQVAPIAPGSVPSYRHTLLSPSPTALTPLTSSQTFSSLPAAALRAHISRANAEGLALIKSRDFQGALDRLKRAEWFANQPGLKAQPMTGAAGQGQYGVASTRHRKEVVQLRSTTANNLAILYKSVNDLRQALHHANKALRMEINFKADFSPAVAADGSTGAAAVVGGPEAILSRPNPAGTHLNLCAILSAMGRHASALLHAECALSSLFLELHAWAQVSSGKAKGGRGHARGRMPRGQYNQQHPHHGEAAEEEQLDRPVLSASDKQGLLQLVAIAYHNMAVEQEYLHHFRAASHSFRRAREFASQRLGAEHLMTRLIEHAYAGATNLHPGRIVGPEQSMDPHAKLDVANVHQIHTGGATAVQPSSSSASAGSASSRSTSSASSSFASTNPRLLRSSLGSIPMNARHIPVRVVPWNHFETVGAITGRSGATRGGRQQQRAESEEEKEAASAGVGAQAGEHAWHDGQFDSSPRDDQGEDEDGPAPLSDAFLRARQAAQKRAMQPSPHSNARFPSHAPPNHAMNAEEADWAAAGGDASAGDPQGQGQEEMGYWSDPEVSDLAPAGSNDHPSGHGHGHRKAKQDPRMAQVRGQRGSTSSRGSASMGTLPYSWQQQQQQQPSQSQPQPQPQQQQYHPPQQYQPQQSQPMVYYAPLTQTQQPSYPYQQYTPHPPPPPSHAYPYPYPPPPFPAAAHAAHPYAHQYAQPAHPHSQGYSQYGGKQAHGAGRGPAQRWG